MAAHLSVVTEHTTRRPRSPWDRQPADTDKSWAAFVAYREQGPDRTYPATAAAVNVTDDRWIRRWADKYDWRRRVIAYDTDQDQALQAKAVAKRWKVAAVHDDIAGAFLARVVQRLRTIDVTQLDMRELVAMTKLAVDIQRDVHFPRADAGVNINAVASIIIDPTLIPPATITDRDSPLVVEAEAL